LRKRAAELLGQRGAPSSEALVKALATAPWELATSIAGALARTDAGAEALLAAVTAGHAAPTLLRHNAVAGPLSSRPPALLEKAAALTKDLPPENARLDQVIAQRAAEYRQALGRPPGERPNPERGQQLFMKNCAVCHRVKGQGGNIGPALDGVGARGIERLLEDILDPNRNVDPAFRQVIVETTDGRTLAGVHPHQSGELLVLNDAEGKETSVPLAQVKSQTISAISLMPPVFEQLLSGPELNDLVTWLLQTAKP
jgi:putative heme-binding domain-containing protein